MVCSDERLLKLPKALAVVVLLAGSAVAMEACKKGACDAGTGGGAETAQGGQGGGQGGSADDPGYADNCRS
jgi:hypothetical protein